MDVSIPNMTETIHTQSINPVQETYSQTKKISLDELAKATETLKKYIYQQAKKEVQGSEKKSVVNEIQLAEQPAITSDALSEEAPLVYETTTPVNRETIAEMPLIQEDIMNNEVDTIISTPVTTVIQPETPIIQSKFGDEIFDDFAKVEPVSELEQQPETQNIDNPPVAELISVDNFAIPENISIPTLDGISQPIVSELTDNSSYVATSNIATVNSDYSTDAPEVIPVTMPDGQLAQENMGEETLVTSPQSFGMM